MPQCRDVDRESHFNSHGFGFCVRRMYFKKVHSMQLGKIQHIFWECQVRFRGQSLSEQVLKTSPNHSQVSIPCDLGKNIWMEIVQKLVAVVLVSVVSNEDGLQLALTITMAMAATSALVQPYAQPQVRFVFVPFGSTNRTNPKTPWERYKSVLLVIFRAKCFVSVSLTSILQSSSGEHIALL